MKFTKSYKIINHCLKFLTESKFAQNVELVDFSNNWVDEETWPLFEQLTQKLTNCSDLNLSSLEPGDYIYNPPVTIKQEYEPYDFNDACFICLANCKLSLLCQKLLCGCLCPPKKQNIIETEKKIKGVLEPAFFESKKVIRKYKSRAFIQAMQNFANKKKKLNSFNGDLSNWFKILGNSSRVNDFL
jgi:hypothetical protein